MLNFSAGQPLFSSMFITSIEIITGLEGADVGIWLYRVQVIFLF